MNIMDAEFERFLDKKYKLATSDNCDAYMKALGIGMLLRQIGQTLPVTKWIQKNGEDTLSLTLSSPLRNHVVNFKLGEWTEEHVSPDGRKVKLFFTQKGCELHQIEKTSNVEALVVRTFTDQQVTTVCSVGDVVCTRVFNAVQ